MQDQGHGDPARASSRGSCSRSAARIGSYSAIGRRREARQRTWARGCGEELARAATGSRTPCALPACRSEGPGGGPSAISSGGDLAPEGRGGRPALRDRAPPWTSWPARPRCNRHDDGRTRRAGARLSSALTAPTASDRNPTAEVTIAGFGHFCSGRCRQSTTPDADPRVPTSGDRSTLRARPERRTPCAPATSSSTTSSPGRR
ncbi:MAG: hypothetical protein MZV64_70875 [Ignavibacteriales bacterium]|nr:hypothetical protein [Ignavibacteriales bacterium]